MNLGPYEHYAAIGTEKATQRWGSWMIFLVVGFLLAGMIGAGLVTRQLQYGLAGAVVGGLLGYAIFRLIVYNSAKRSADELYTFDWCSARGMTHRRDGVFPPDAPYASSGDEREAEDIFEGTWNGYETLFYNFTYTVRARGKDQSDEHHEFRIMRMRGATLPIARLTIHQRSAANRFKWVDKLQGAFTPERPVSLESAEFNAKFDLTIDDDADDIWIRRIFDPATIADLVSGDFTIPDLRYYNGCWWLVERGHFEISELEQWVPRQALVARAADHLSRVQSL